MPNRPSFLSLLSAGGTTLIRLGERLERAVKGPDELGAFSIVPTPQALERLRQLHRVAAGHHAQQRAAQTNPLRPAPPRSTHRTAGVLNPVLRPEAAQQAYFITQSCMLAHYGYMDPVTRDLFVADVVADIASNSSEGLEGVLMTVLVDIGARGVSQGYTEIGQALALRLKDTLWGGGRVGAAMLDIGPSCLKFVSINRLQSNEAKLTSSFGAMDLPAGVSAVRDSAGRAALCGLTDVEQDDICGYVGAAGGLLARIGLAWANKNNTLKGVAKVGAEQAAGYGGSKAGTSICDYLINTDEEQAALEKKASDAYWAFEAAQTATGKARQAQVGAEDELETKNKELDALNKKAAQAGSDEERQTISVAVTAKKADVTVAEGNLKVANEAMDKAKEAETKALEDSIDASAAAKSGRKKNNYPNPNEDATGMSAEDTAAMWKMVHELRIAAVSMPNPHSDIGPSTTAPQPGGIERLINPVRDPNAPADAANISRTIGTVRPLDESGTVAVYTPSASLTVTAVSGARFEVNPGRWSKISDTCVEMSLSAPAASRFSIRRRGGG